MIAAGESGTFAELSQTPRLGNQLAAARGVLESHATQTGDATGNTGAEGQTGEHQHTPEPEEPEVQPGQKYEHEQVEVDPVSRTRSLPDAGQPETVPAARQLDIVNPASCPR